MAIADKSSSGDRANRGIGQALVDEALRRGAKRVYAGARQPLAHVNARVTPLVLDVTNAAQIQAALERVESLDILINNAGLALFDDLSDREVARTAPSRQSLRYVRRDPHFPAVADSLSGSHRQRSVAGGLCRLADHSGLLDLQGGRVLPVAIAARPFGRTGCEGPCRPAGPRGHGYVPSIDVPKASPESVARAIFDGVENGDQEIFPDPTSASLAESWRSSALKALERDFAALVPAEPVTS